MRFGSDAPQQGVHVEYEPPQEWQLFGADVGAVALSLVAPGLYDGIKAGVARFQERFPRYVVVIVGDEEPYQLGFAPTIARVSAAKEDAVRGFADGLTRKLPSVAGMGFVNHPCRWLG